MLREQKNSTLYCLKQYRNIPIWIGGVTMEGSVIYEWASKNVKGFNGLSSSDQELFLEIYTRHQAGHGMDFKDNWKAVSVRREQRYFKVVFKNGQWLHYYLDGSWG